MYSKSQKSKKFLKEMLSSILYITSVRVWLFILKSLYELDFLWTIIYEKVHLDTIG